MSERLAGARELLEQAAALENELSAIGEQAERLARQCREGILPSGEDAGALRESLDGWMSRSARLRSYSRENDLGDSLPRIVRALDDLVRQEDENALREEASAFLGLRCLAESLTGELEENKASLRLALEQGDTEALRPYRTAVREIRGLESGEEDLNAMEDAFSRAFSRAVYRRKLALPEEESTQKQPEAKQEQPEMEKPEDARRRTEGEQEKIPEAEPPKAEQAQPEAPQAGPEFPIAGYESLTGRLKDVRVENPSVQLQSKKFIRDVYKKGSSEYFDAFLAAAVFKVVTLRTIDDFSHFTEDSFAYLFKKGYLARISAAVDGRELTAYCLSSAGYGSFRKGKTTWEEFQKAALPRLREPEPLPPSALTPAAVERLVQAQEGMLQVTEERDEEDFIRFWAWDPERRYLFYKLTRPDGPEIWFLSGVLEPGEGRAYLEAMEQTIRQTENAEFVICLYSQTDAGRLESFFGFDEALRGRVRYRVVPLSDALEGPPERPSAGEEGSGEDRRTEEAPQQPPAPESGPEDSAKPPKPPKPDGGKGGAWDGGRPEEGAEEDAAPRSGDWDSHAAVYEGQALALFAQEKFPEAISILRSLSLRLEAYRDIYRKFAYALDDPALDKRYKYTQLQQVFAEGFGGDRRLDALGLAAYLRMFFSSDAAEEAYYLRDCPEMLDQNLVYGDVPKLKDLIFELSQVFTAAKRGYDSGVLAALLSSGKHQIMMERYCAVARNLQESNVDGTVENKRVRATRATLFGKDSPLYEILTIVANNETGKAAYVQKQLGGYLKDPGAETELFERGHLSQAVMDDMMDEAWDKNRDATLKEKYAALRDPARTSIQSKLEEMITTALNWAALSGGGQKRAGTHPALRNRQSRIVLLLEECSAALEGPPPSDSGEAASYAVLRRTLWELAVRMRNGRSPHERKFFYAPFLRGSRIELGSDFIPVLEEAFEDVSRHNVCERVWKLAHDPDTSWEEVLRRIFLAPANEGGCDYGHAELIREYLRTARPDFQWPESYDVERACQAVEQKLLEQYESDFRGKLEMASGYGWVEDNARLDRVEADMDKRKEHYRQSRNFGFYFRTMDAVIDYLNESAEVHREMYETRLRGMEQRYGAKHPCFSEIRRLIGEKMYTVAQDYMDQIEKSDKPEIPQSASLTGADDYLSGFLSRYARCLSDARVTGRSLREAYERLHKGENNNTTRTGRELLESFPRSPGRGNASKLHKLLERLGPQDRKGALVQEVQSLTDSRFLVRFRQKTEEVFNYPHPISKFGSEMQESGLDVFTVFGEKTAVTLNAIIQNTMTAAVTRPSLFLVDSALSLAERRNLAKKIKTENQNLTPYVVLDRVLLLYLAEQKLEERWNAFLNCALPFHYYNPYFESSGSRIPPEMFIGRRSELNEVIAASGANIIYGGRQLGKTALLQRAEKLEHIPAAGKWAVCCEIKQMDAADAAVKIYDTLRNAGFLDGPREERADWNVLEREIVGRMCGGKERAERLLLLLDEADAFLSSCEEAAYKPIDCLERMQKDTNSRFKFVLAGLHNVLRFNKRATSDNASLVHLTAIPIKPLGFKDASELLEKPLAYLGFRMRPEDTPFLSQILSSTNYYPGLIQFYASRLVKSMCSNYGDAANKPPYNLQEAQILTLLKDRDFIYNIKEKFISTLEVDGSEDGYYKSLAYVLAHCYYALPAHKGLGYTAEDIFRTCGDLGIRSVTALDVGRIEVLLDELCELNVLRRAAEGRYIFNRANFRHMLGDEDAIEEVLLEIMEKEHGPV